jgi:hypothetical protein
MTATITALDDPDYPMDFEAVSPSDKICAYIKFLKLSLG